jgi:hypothetical protein
MKTKLTCVLAALTLLSPAQEPDKRFVVVPIGELTPGPPKPVPLFFSVTANVEASVGMESVISEQRIDFKIHQGKPEILTLALAGSGEVESVSGGGLKDWSVRIAVDGSRFLDLRPEFDPEKPPASFGVVVKTRAKAGKEPVALLLPGPGTATGFSLSVTLAGEAGTDLRISRADGLMPLDAERSRRFLGYGAAALEVSATTSGYVFPDLELIGSRLDGRLAEDGNSVSFRLTTTARAKAADARVELAAGIALSGPVSGDGWHVVLREGGYDLVAERGGDLSLALEFVAPVIRRGDWRVLDFKLPAGVVVPLALGGLGGGVSFDASLAVVPEREGDGWRGFLPANGRAALAWRPAETVVDGALFFSSTEATDVRIGSGLMRQLITVDLRVLQGVLGELSFSMAGPGEVLGVTGEAVVGWSVTEAEGGRRLAVKLARPLESGSKVVIEAQTALGGFPVRTEALRVIPTGSLRHGGWLRIANEGAVRIDVADARGLIQLAPGQFPGPIAENPRQLFVYRFPSSDYGYEIRADQVLPEVSVTEVTVYEIAETDRRVSADLELDIREVPLREWEMEIPADHAVAAVTGAQVADYAVAGEVREGRKRLKIIFKQAVANRQLVSVRLEKSEAAAAGDWSLQPLVFPGAKSRRGYVGAVAAAGYRLQLLADRTSGVAEVPVTFFPKKEAGLQQAFRLREGDWKIGLAVEALGQSVQADVFHLYSLKAGAAYGSVLINYFVVGAPATEWRISVPEGIGNIELTGQNVGLDWRREGNTLIVPLSQAIVGTGTVLLTFEQPMSARGGEISPGEVRPLSVQAERGFVQVVSPLQVKFTEPVSSGALLAIDASELPTEFRLLSSAPTLAAWQYTARDFKIGMVVEWFEPGETVSQAVDFLKLASKVSRDGEWVTDAGFFLKSRGRSGLRAMLPDGAVLWEVKVDGQAVNARDDGGATLIPLPLKTDPNEAVEVSLRYGARGDKASRVRVVAPVLDAPVIIGEWKVTGDEGRELVPRGGTAKTVRPTLAPSGWEWLAENPRPVMLLLVLGVIGWALGTSSEDTARGFTLLPGLGFLLTACWAILLAKESAWGNPGVLEYAVPVMEAGGEVVLEIANVTPLEARTGWGMWLLFLSGALFMTGAVWKGSRMASACGLVLLGMALLSIHGGAPLFFGALALASLVGWGGRLRRWMLDKRAPKIAGAVAAVSFLTIFQVGGARAAELPVTKPAESMVHDWQIKDGRLRGTVDVSLRAEIGDRFLLLREPVVLGGFEGVGLRVVKERAGDGEAYFLIAESSGKLTGKAVFEMPLPAPEKGWELPSGPAAMREVALKWNQAGWEFFSEGAAKSAVPAGLAADESGTVMVMGPADPVIIQARPKQRDAGTEETRFFAEVSNLFLPGPGVVNGRHRVSIRPAQGRVSSLVMKVPEGFTVSDVIDGPVGAWRFDPEKRELRVPVDPAQDRAFAFTVESQRGASVLPMDLDLAPLRVEGAAGEVGLLALAFGDEAQPESIRVDGLSRVNPEDFNSALLPRDSEGNPLALLQNAFRYGSGEVVAHVRVAAVAAELRAESWQLVSLGEDRLVVSSDLSVSITRTGVFRLVLELPEGLEVETATGEGLSHWTEGRDAGRRSVTLHLSARSAGTRSFHLTLTGRPPGPVESWQVPRLSLRDASRETGVVTIVPERGLQVRAVERKNISQLDPRELTEETNPSTKAATRPGALVYRMLQGDWALGLSISRLDPWVTAQVLQEVTLREGQVLTRVGIDYKIENAALKSLRVRIPGLDATAAATVRANGAAVADLLPVVGQPDLWDIQFQRGVAGETRVELEFQRAGNESGGEIVQPLVLQQVRQLSYFTAVRAGGRLELEAGVLPRGWQRTDWSVVRSTLGRPAGNIAPLMAFRVADPEGPLPVVMKRHRLADQRRLRVAEGSLTTLLSAAGQTLTAVDLKMEVSVKGTLRLQLPPDSKLFNVRVNDEGATLVREGDGWLFHVFPAAEAGRPAAVRFVYSAPTERGERLEGPLLNMPMENLTWRVLVPEGWRLAGHGGDFELKRQSLTGSFGLEDYQSFVRGKKESDAKNAVALLDQANSWLAAGDQEKAGNAFSNAVRSNQLDAASGEDARVQLRELKTRQAVLGLNTRRQKLLMDHRSSAPGVEDARLDRAAEENPVLRGGTNYDPKHFDRFLDGNTVDENAALKEIANRIVTQQLAAEPAPVALDVTLPERGTLVTFGRSVQTDGEKPMAITLDLKRASGGFAWLAVPLCLLLGAFGGAVRFGRRG